MIKFRFTLNMNFLRFSDKFVCSKTAVILFTEIEFSHVE